MKKNDIILILSVAAYSFLFYQQIPGVNFLIFSVLMVIALLEKDREVIKSAQWVGAALGSIVSGFAVMYYGTFLALTANILSLGLLAVFSVSRSSSVILGWLYAAYSIVTSVAFMIVDYIERRKQRATDKGNNIWMKIGIGIGIIIVVLVFFFLYQKSNALFKNLTEKINFDWISWSWVRFTLLGFIILYGFFFLKRIPGLNKIEDSSSENLNKEKVLAKENTFFGKIINLKIENMSGVILLMLLNFLILMVNVLDIVYVWTGAELPSDMTYSDMVHQGVGQLILSIIIAILIILFLFRGHLNYFTKSKIIKTLAFIWIVQNVIMILSAGFKNQLYIDAYSLTHRRIGVYFYLLMAVIGLVTTFVKISGKKSNWFLFRKNGWAWFVVLVFASLFNWDMIITRFNIKHSDHLDLKYLVSLNYTNIAELMTLDDSKYEQWTNPDIERRLNRSGYDYSKSFEGNVHSKMYDFIERHNEKGWRSWCFYKEKTYKKIMVLLEKDYVKKLDLSDNNLNDIIQLESFNKIKELNVGYNSLDSLHCLKQFSNLEKLKLTGNYLDRIDDFPAFSDLEFLKLDNNNINDFSPLGKCRNIKVLNVSSNGFINLSGIGMLENLEVLDISQNSVNELKPLSKLDKLNRLNISNMNNVKFGTFPQMHSLKSINLANNSFSTLDFDYVKFLKKIENVETLNLSGNKLSSLLLLTNYYELPIKKGFFSNRRVGDPVSYLPALTRLDFSDNKLKKLDAIDYFESLEKLNVSNNKIKSIDPGKEVSITYLDLRRNFIRDLRGIEYFPNLNYLDLSYNELTEIGQLSKVKNLATLDLSENDIISLEPLKALPNLKKLYLNGNEIKDLSPLSELKGLKILNIRNNNITDLSPLYKLTNLKELHVNSISDDQLKEIEATIPGIKVVYDAYNDEDDVIMEEVEF
jgi:Leucine-rich repeat (LRR) protein